MAKRSRRWRWVPRWPWMRRLAYVALTVVTAGIAVLGWAWLTVPDIRPLRTTVPERTAFMAIRAADAERAGRVARHSWEWVSYDQISPVLVRAVLVTEDAGFWDHEGVDWFEVRTALWATASEGAPLRGASTITQQLAKNLYLSPTRNPLRKLQELFITRRLEAELGKQRILELYLNLIEWGDGIWGVQAASRAYFGVTANQLTIEQAALLAGAIANPRVYNPANPGARLRSRQATVLRRLR